MNAGFEFDPLTVCIWSCFPFHFMTMEATSNKEDVAKTCSLNIDIMG